MSSGGISSRLSGSVRSGSDDGSKTRSAFHGEANSPVVQGIACALAADEPRPSRIAATGPGRTPKLRRSCAFVEQSRPGAPNRPGTELDPISHPSRELGRRRAFRTQCSLLRKRSSTAHLNGRPHTRYVRRKGLKCCCGVMRPPETRCLSKVSLRCEKFFAVQERTVALRRHKRVHVERTRRET